MRWAPKNAALLGSIKKRLLTPCGDIVDIERCLVGSIQPILEPLLSTKTSVCGIDVWVCACPSSLYFLDVFLSFVEGLCCRLGKAFKIGASHAGIFGSAPWLAKVSKYAQGFGFTHTTPFQCIMVVSQGCGRMVHIYIYTYKYIQIHTDTYKYIQIHTNTYRYIQIRTNTYKYIQIRTNTYKYIQIRTNTYKYIQIRTNT